MDNIDKTPLLTPVHDKKQVARYRTVLWEPIPSTGERVVALIAIEPVMDARALPATYVALRRERLRAILGARRGDASWHVLDECSRYMSGRQAAGVPLEQLEPLFSGFSLGPIHQGRATTYEQLFNAALRASTIFALENDFSRLDEDDVLQPVVTQRTAEFIRQIRRTFAAGSQERQQRFNVKLQIEESRPVVTVDYADGPIIVQVTSVPGSANQAPPAEAELKSKLLDLEVLKKEFLGNSMTPAILLNVRSLHDPLDAESERVAAKAHQQILRYADWAQLKVMEVSNAAEAADQLETLHR